MSRDRYMKCWRHLIVEEQEASGDTGPILVCTLTPEALEAEFDTGYGGTRGDPFTAWTQKRVYFPVCYDGAEWVASVPRDPCEEATEHVGGGS